MPVIFDQTDFKAWVTGASGAEFLSPTAEDLVRMCPVSWRVNDAGIADDDPTLADEVTA